MASKRSPLVYYLDESLTHRCPVNESGEALIDWGVTVPGAKKEKTLYVKNITKDKLVIRQPYTNDEDLTIKDFPVRLMGNDSGEIHITFEPNIERLDPLKSSWGFEEIVIG